MKNVQEQLQTMGLKQTLENKLQEEYQIALKNPSFQNLIKEAHLPTIIAQKYTSNLETSASEYEHCKNCRNLTECQNKIHGYAYLPFRNQDKLEFKYKACRFQKQDLQQKKIENYITRFSSQISLKDATMENIQKRDKSRFPAIEWVSDFIDTYQNNPNQKGLYLHGPFGCGKTFLITVLLYELAKKKIQSTIIFWPEYLRELKASFDSDFKEKFDKVKKTPILLIDDIGAESTTPWGRDEILCPILQYRMEEKLPTFFTSNFDIDSLEQHLSMSKSGVEKVKARRIKERIIQLTEQIHLQSKNMRNE